MAEILYSNTYERELLSFFSKNDVPIFEFSKTFSFDIFTCLYRFVLNGTVFSLETIGHFEKGVYPEELNMKKFIITTTNRKTNTKIKDFNLIEGEYKELEQTLKKMKFKELFQPASYPFTKHIIAKSMDLCSMSGFTLTEEELFLNILTKSKASSREHLEVILSFAERYRVSISNLVIQIDIERGGFDSFSIELEEIFQETKKEKQN